MRQTIFVLRPAFPYGETFRLLCEALERTGTVKESNFAHGFLSGRLVTAKNGRARVDFYLERGALGPTNVRAVVHRADVYVDSHLLQAEHLRIDDLWDEFLLCLFRLRRGASFGVQMSAGLQVAAVQFLSGRTRRVLESRTTGGISLAGFLAGGMLFGPPGALIGGLSGTRRTRTQYRTAAANEVLLRAVMTNGRITEGLLATDSYLYHQIMVRVQ